MMVMMTQMKIFHFFCSVGIYFNFYFRFRIEA